MRKRLDFITGLRGYAALMVFLIHGGTFIGNYNPFLNKLVGFGRYGVIVFFVISAFTLCMSIAATNKFSFKKYLLKRFFRIAPMYYLVVILAFLFGSLINLGGYYQQMFNIHTFSISNLFYHLTFLSLFNEKYQNSLIGAEWTVPLEFFYYLIIPSIFFIAKKYKIGLVFLLFLGLLFYLNRTIFFPFYVTRFGGGDWAIETFFATYVVGIGAFFITTMKTKFRISKVVKSDSFLLPFFLGLGFLLYVLSFIQSGEKFIWVLLGFVLIYGIFMRQNFLQQVSKKKFAKLIVNVDITALILLLILYINYATIAPELFVTFFSAAIIFFSIEGGLLVKFLLENKAILHIGRISYSFYLIHLIVITSFHNIILYNNGIKFLTIFIITLILATLTEKFIERPFIERAKVLATR